MSTEKLRVSIIGLGLGSWHADKIEKNPNADLVAVADIDESKFGALANRLGREVKGYTDYKELLEKEKPDVTIVALPNFLHHPVTIAALRSGSNVLCEKPMAMSVSQAEEMKAVAQECGRVLGVNLSYRFNPQSRALKELADAGSIGEAYHAFTRWTRRDGIPGFGGWFGQKKMSGGGPLIDLGVHRIDLAMWLMGHPKPVTVSGQTHHRIGVPRASALGKAFDVEDFATGFVRFENDCSLAFEISWAGHQEEHEPMLTRVMGTRGALVQKNTGEGYSPKAYYATELEGQKMTAEVHPKPGYRESLDEFIDCILNDRPFLVTPDDGIRVQKVLDALYESAAIGREVEVK